MEKCGGWVARCCSIGHNIFVGCVAKEAEDGAGCFTGRGACRGPRRLEVVALVVASITRKSR